VEPEKPFVVTARCLQAWQVVGRSLQAAQPLLLIGRDGCGKSDSLRVLSWLLGMQLQALNMTPETEPSALVGQYLPAATPGQGDPVVWVDGAVTAAYKAGSWLCLDGLGEAEAAVLERLNPLLEQPAFWVPTEHGHTQPLPHKDSFRFMGTMTPPANTRAGGVGNLTSELSPAMYNRLSLVVLEDALEGSMESFRQEMLQLAAALCVDDSAQHSTNASSSASAQDVAAACCEIKSWETQQQTCSVASFAPLTLRNYVRLLDMSYRVQCRVGLPLQDSFLAAFDLSLAGQLSAASADAVQQLRNRLAQLLQVSDWFCLQFNCPVPLYGTELWTQFELSKVTLHVDLSSVSSFGQTTAPAHAARLLLCRSLFQEATALTSWHVSWTACHMIMCCPAAGWAPHRRWQQASSATSLCCWRVLLQVGDCRLQTCSTKMHFDSS
jgi:hypothetical protein